VCKKRKTGKEKNEEHWRERKGKFEGNESYSKF
jgi:hypothetical protein